MSEAETRVRRRGRRRRRSDALAALRDATSYGGGEESPTDATQLLCQSAHVRKPSARRGEQEEQVKERRGF
eukprot:750668-Hanusia_phi.AAC.1